MTGCSLSAGGKGGVEQARPLLIRSLDCKYQSTKVGIARAVERDAAGP